MVNGFSGEIGAKIESISISKPYDGFHDLTFKTEDGAFLHITGNNNMVELLGKALEKYKEDAYQRKVKESISVGIPW